LATISVALATAGITIIFDENKMARIEQLAVSAAPLPGDVSTSIWPTLPAVDCTSHPSVTEVHQTRLVVQRCILTTLRVPVQLKDPMMRNLEGGTLVPPIAIVAAALGALYAGFICFAQSVRLYVHTGFYIRACTSQYNPGTLTVAEAKRVAIHAGLAFTGEQLVRPQQHL
jgi:hypothetical protein